MNTAHKTANAVNTANGNLNDIRYGYVATNDLDPEVIEVLMYGCKTVYLDYLFTQEKLVKGFAAHLNCQIPPAPEPSDEPLEQIGFDGVVRFQEAAEEWRDRCLEILSQTDSDIFQQFEDIMEDSMQAEEPTVFGLYEGVYYMSSWLGGALHFFLINSPHLVVAPVCSPCVPNAGNLNRDCIPVNNAPKVIDDLVNGRGVVTYGVPADWWAEDY